MASSYVRYNDGEWSALYKDGVLVKIGDSYITDDYLARELGVVEHDNANYFLGKDATYDNAAQTLDEVIAYEKTLDEKWAEAEALIAQADALRAQAEALLKK